MRVLLSAAARHGSVESCMPIALVRSDEVGNSAGPSELRRCWVAVLVLWRAYSRKRGLEVFWEAARIPAHRCARLLCGMAACIVSACLVRCDSH
eukprot:CAMPEP_0119426094 /NCGR_PEP_ID=MMETSP1335-20130426/35708_1 /TAXON_ID=259385 /ORGANISM="Chrysoculter rhomboideus, Strain RCC1486" /LENGTH=93 /DNA_ID=CAMNT_0007451675 /DNA_START=395 /DNA_END=673 /DNA_ORIENTATION=-